MKKLLLILTALCFVFPTATFAKSKKKQMQSSLVVQIVNIAKKCVLALRLNST